MTFEATVPKTPGKRRLSRAQRRTRLLSTALEIVRSDGVDRLTLGRLAEIDSVSKPVVYDHFPTRSHLLIELYRTIDLDRVAQFESLMARKHHGAEETARLLATAYIQCAGSTGDEFSAIGSALAGSPEKAEVFQELLANSVRMFVAVLRPHHSVAEAELHRHAVALVGAGEALAAEMMRGGTTENEAIETFAGFIRAGLRTG